MVNSKLEIFNFNENDLTSDKQINLYKYWLQLKGDKLMPTRADFDPMKIPKSLPNIILTDVSYDPLRFKTKLIGSKLKIPMFVKDKYLDEYDYMLPIIEMISLMIKNKKPYFYRSQNQWTHNIYDEYSSVVLPFSNDGENINIIISCHVKIII